MENNYNGGLKKYRRQGLLAEYVRRPLYVMHTISMRKKAPVENILLNISFELIFLSRKDLCIYDIGQCDVVGELKQCA